MNHYYGQITTHINELQEKLKQCYICDQCGHFTSNEVTHSSHLTNCIYQHQQFRWEVAQDHQSNEPTNQNTNQQPNSQQQGWQRANKINSLLQDSQQLARGRTRTIIIWEEICYRSCQTILKKIPQDEQNSLNSVTTKKSIGQKEKENTSVNYIRRIKQCTKLLKSVFGVVCKKAHPKGRHLRVLSCQIEAVH
ncbi:Hypothetical_protein [Hexamita inflata]|uniref:Hypothetical_protein n=1 Tax=Hexamita inflata TaxID=28002 RepID=A0AA86TGC6_9EUKA|nr:Hypothetical protein HINF_LOCUS3032 [Hexamita inflata]